VANLLTSLVAARLSRRDEYEADEWASALLVKAGIGTAPQKSLFAKLGRITGQAGAAPAWLMSHPKTVDRIAAIEANEREWGLNVEPRGWGGSARALHGTPDGPGREGQRDGHEGRVADPARQRHPVRRGAVAGQRGDDAADPSAVVEDRAHVPERRMEGQDACTHQLFKPGGEERASQKQQHRLGNAEEPAPGQKAAAKLHQRIGRERQGKAKGDGAEDAGEARPRRPRDHAVEEDHGFAALPRHGDRGEDEDRPPM